MRLTSLALCLLLSATTLNLSAQNINGDAQTKDEQAIRQFFANAEAAWNHHSAEQLTNPQTTVADADFINVYGGWTKGRGPFVIQMGRLQAGPFHDITRHTVVEKIHFVRPDVAVVITTSTDRKGDNPPIQSRATHVLSKEEGHWLLNSFQNTEITTPPGPPPTSSGPPH